MNKINLYDSILSPVVTEKSTNLSELNKVVFKVNSLADKKSIKKSIEKIFKVNVIKINIINKQRRIKKKNELKWLKVKFIVINFEENE